MLTANSAGQIANHQIAEIILKKKQSKNLQKRRYEYNVWRWSTLDVTDKKRQLLDKLLVNNFRYHTIEVTEFL